ncbi:MAG: hypothetical protein WAN66_27145 [Limnoraphis robusta]|uniref:hypothetical protein n=1 Tax=Limnoraphis robusta TaxID=1118279 RepID=UPI00061B0F3B|nr:hypothetical protein [Limnoraphis robusta]
MRSLIGFTRIQSPGDFDDAGDIPEEYRVRLSRHQPEWVPATEVKGEGIFLPKIAAHAPTFRYGDIRLFLML